MSGYFKDPVLRGQVGGWTALGRTVRVEFCPPADDGDQDGKDFWGVFWNLSGGRPRRNSDKAGITIPVAHNGTMQLVSPRRWRV